MIHFNIYLIFFFFFFLNRADAEQRAAGEEDALGRLTSDCLMACKGVKG